MKIASTLAKYHFSQDFIETVTREGFHDFFPPQEETIKKGLLDGKNLLLSMPTASGKTLMAELCMLKSILQNDGRCLYIAPLKA